MTSRETRTIRAFENCIMQGTYTADYAITLIEDDKRYGWLSVEAKDEFYAWLDAYEASLAEVEAVEEVVEEAPADNIVEE